MIIMFKGRYYKVTTESMKAKSKIKYTKSLSTKVVAKANETSLMPCGINLVAGHYSRKLA